MANQHVNAIVVGAGAGGGVVAKELSAAGLSVVLFERGGWVGFDEHRHDELINQRTTVLGNGFGPDDRRHRRVIAAGPGKWRVVLPSEGGCGNNAACVGSGTVSYGAMAWRFMEQDFRMRSTYGALAGSTLEDWPLIYAELEPYYEKAEYEIGVAGAPERPLNITLWGGQTDLAQALWRVKQERGPAGVAALVRTFRVYDVADQDGIAEWMRTEFPGMFYILAKAPAGRAKEAATFRGMYLTGDEALTSRAWIDENVRSRGPLGALYPVKTYTTPNPHSCLKEGDAPSWLFFLPLGGNDPRDPSKPGWGGQHVRQPDGWYRDLPARPGFDPRATVSRWRPDFQRDFARRVAWGTAHH